MAKLTYDLAAVVNGNRIYLMANDDDYTIFAERTTSNAIEIILEGFKKAFKEAIKSGNLFVHMSTFAALTESVKKARVILFVETEDSFLFPDIRPTSLELEIFKEMIENEEE